MQLHFLDALYSTYKDCPSKIDPSWTHFFEGMEYGLQGKQQEDKGAKVAGLVHAYRSFGHLFAYVNPLKDPPSHYKELEPARWGFYDLQEEVPSYGFSSNPTMRLSELVAVLKSIYCQKIGIEYMGLENPELEKYIQNRMEPQCAIQLTPEEKKGILSSLHSAELLETFLHTKYVGQKRFSLEGEETLIPLLRFLIEKSVDLGYEGAVLGMSHRGRLNVLANILGKSYTEIFCEFEDYYKPDLLEGTGDVKYHKGFSGTFICKTGKEASLILSANPSHLESVNPVVEGQVYALQKTGRKFYPIIIHGDAAIAGQGVVYETLQLQGLQGYGTQGTVHIVVNNHIGFTTQPEDSRSTRYCTDIARSFGAPVFHVNAEDPQSCVIAAILAIEIKERFACDVFIDLNGYRKYGHNESDEPYFTQPLAYQTIQTKKTIRALYVQQLIQEGLLLPSEADAEEEALKQQLHIALSKISSYAPVPVRPSHSIEPKETRIAEEKVRFLMDACTKIPEGFSLHPKVERLVKERKSAVQEIDWATAEILAYASLIDEGTHVRLSGQDVRRGTFSHRHSVWVDQKSGQGYSPLDHIRPGQPPFTVYNSPLSEYAVLGFEFGYSLTYKNALVIWEAQFGDFANGAQIIIDQYIASAEQKWGRASPLVLMLPHGYEGQGPEHSSARIERFLQLSGQDNMYVVNPTTPSQLFHVLRRQAQAKRPLILFTPKALLRHPLVRSSMNSLCVDTFFPVLDDPITQTAPRKLLLCSGKIYYDLFKEREKRAQTNVVIVRIEQLYPFPATEVERICKKYSMDPIWVQEEHANMGAASYIRSLMPTLKYVGRAPAASPAVGSHSLHDSQYKTLMDEAFA